MNTQKITMSVAALALGSVLAFPVIASAATGSTASSSTTGSSMTTSSTTGSSMTTSSTTGTSGRKSSRSTLPRTGGGEAAFALASMAGIAGYAVRRFARK